MALIGTVNLLRPEDRQLLQFGAYTREARVSRFLGFFMFFRLRPRS